MYVHTLSLLHIHTFSSTNAPTWAKWHTCVCVQSLHLWETKRWTQVWPGQTHSGFSLLINVHISVISVKRLNTSCFGRICQRLTWLSRISLYLTTQFHYVQEKTSFLVDFYSPGSLLICWRGGRSRYLLLTEDLLEDCLWIFGHADLFHPEMRGELNLNCTCVKV